MNNIRLKNKSIKKSIPRFLPMLACIFLFFSVCILMNYVEELLYSDVEINLTEVVTQNKDVITSKLNLEVNNIELFADHMEEQLKDYDQIGEEELKEAFYQVNSGMEDEKFFVASANGTAFTFDGTVFNIEGRKYFRLALEGIQNVSEKIISRVDGEDVFTISVPLRFADKIVGTVQKSYTTDEMYNLCAISLFSSQGYMSIINSEGYIIVSTQNTEYTQESDNYFRSIYSEENKSEIRKLQRDIKEERSGFMEMKENDKTVFSAYTPIYDIHDWYLITSIDKNAVSPNTSLVIKIFYFILMVIVTVFGASMFYFLRYKKKQQSRLEHIAFFDTVTFGDTYNKFVVDVVELLAQFPDDTFYIMAFDIDNFKYVNSYYGFDVGDKILRGINRTVGSKLTKDERIARVSGDHFVVLIKDADERRLKDLLKMHQNEEGVIIYFTAGLYEIKNRTESVDLMVDKATTAAQEVKGIFNSNKQIQVYSENFENQIVQNEQMKRAVEQALEEDEIVPYYQPKVDVNTGKLIGAEALARWIKKDGSLVSPAQFIPISEKTGLITELDHVIFVKTLQFIKRNLDEGISCTPISVNFSRLHLQDKKFLEKVITEIKKYGIPYHLVELEITESAFFENSEIILDFANKLHEFGLSISMDDFGSGYSSLNMLNDIPIDVLKIDRAFLKNTDNSDRQRIILAAIAEMAIQLNIKVVVEGVETLDNVKLMKEIGFIVAQGYYFARPMDAKSFEKVYREGMIC